MCLAVIRSIWHLDRELNLDLRLRCVADRAIARASVTGNAKQQNKILQMP